MTIRRAHPLPRAVASHRRSSARRIRDLRVRTKLLLVLTIPLLGFLGVTGVQVASSIGTAAELDGFSRRVALGREIDALVHELQRERDRTVGLLAAADSPDTDGGRSINVADLAPDRTAVDRALAAWAAAARQLRPDQTFESAYRTADASLADLPRLRDGVQSGWLREAAAFDAYTDLITDLHALLLVPAVVGGDPELGQAVSTLANASRAKELTARIRGLLFAVCSASGFGPGEFELIADVRAQQRAAMVQLRDGASAHQLASWDDAVSGQAVRNASRLEQTVVDNASAPELGVDPQQWWQASTTQLELIRGAEQRLLDAAIAAAESRSGAQLRSTQLVTVGSVALAVVALLTSFLIGRTMVRSLHSLREQALDVAQRRLPAVIEELRTAPKGAPIIAVDPIAIRGGDEVGEVAEAFTAVHRNAVRLAAEQAKMRHNVNAIYVNLARRSQTLVERQLKLLDTLESAEADPDQLANLFRLDHLATRMRRNDDNLLVLAGGDASRRWNEPVALNAVVLAAVAEIEDYTRVRHDITDNIHVVGHVVADLVHLLAELLENATIFSPSNTMVSVLGWTSKSGATLTIKDGGMGMSAEAVARANRRLLAPASIDVAAAERMGLVVVGHLAHRHRITVELRPHDEGLAVSVALPANLLAEPGAHSTSWSAGPAQWLRTDRDSQLTAAIAADSTAGATGSGAEGPGTETTSAALARPVAGARPSGATSIDSGLLARAGHGTEAGDAAELRVSTGHRRAVPTRAEDVLRAGGIDPASHWWTARPSGSPRQLAVPAPMAPDRARPDATTSTGLPVRVPMTNLPGTSEVAAVPATAVADVADPTQVGSVLSQFYGGVRRAATEDDEHPHNVT